MPDAEKSESIFQFGSSELIQASIATALTLVVRVLLAVFKLNPHVPEWLQGTLTPEQLTTATAGVLWLAVVFAIFVWKKWRNRRRHVQGVAEAGKVNIWVAELEGDGRKGDRRTNITYTLSQELGPSVKVLRAGLELKVEEAGDAANDAAAADRKAQEFLRKHAGDLLIWGRVVENTKVIALHFTSAVHDGTEERRYPCDDVVQLPENFGAELGTALAAVVAQQALPAMEGGRYVADVLAPMAQKVAKLVDAPPATMRPEDIGQILFSYACAEVTLAQQGGGRDDLVRAVQVFRQTLNNWTRESFPRRWVMAQIHLGDALRALGELGAEEAPFAEAVQATGEAFKELQRDRDPLGWASAQNSLGKTFLAWGRSECADPGSGRGIANLLRASEGLRRGIEHFEQAAQAFRLALEEWTRDRVPLNWAGAQSALALTLMELARRQGEGGTRLLEDAIQAFRLGLEIWTRDRVPLNWAGARYNLGLALVDLGRRQPGEEGKQFLQDAIQAFSTALEEMTRGRVPFTWAWIHNDLGNAFLAQGRLDDAEKAYRQALAVFTPEAHPEGHGKVTRNLERVNRRRGTAAS